MTIDTSPEAADRMATLLYAQGAADEAILLYRAALDRTPGHAALTVNLARLLRASPETVEEAIALLEAVVSADPGYRPAQLSLAETVRTAAGRPEVAEQRLRAWLARWPEDGGGHLALALALFDQGRLAETILACRSAIRLSADPARAWELAGNAHVGLGDPVEAAAAYRGALRLRPDADLHSRLLMALHYCDTATIADITAETARWAAAHHSGILPRPDWPHLDRRPERPLRVGFVSGDFRQCSTPLLALPLFRNLPPDWIVTLYDTQPTGDAYTAQFDATVAARIDIAALDDEQACARIIADRIDVLIDLNGHTLGGRLGIFCRKPAPVQLAWLDYVGSTGLDTFDGIVADAGHLPITDQPHYREPIRHVAGNLYRYAPPASAPGVSVLPAARQGFITFGCFNSAYKLSPTTLACWAAILRAVPTARLILNSREFGCDDAVARFVGLFARQGIDGGRIAMRPGSPSPEGMMAAYGEIDIALDPFPYSGGLTTLEALYMGVPVVTMPGDRFGSRHSSVHLRTIGLDDWIAGDAATYVDLAIRKAAAIGELAVLRDRLRARMAASPLMDGGALARDLSGLVRTLWRAAARPRQEATATAG